MRGEWLARSADRVVLNRWVSRAGNTAFLGGIVVAIIKAAKGADVLTVATVALLALGVALMAAPPIQRWQRGRHELGVGPSSDDSAAALAQQFSMWVDAKRAALPDWPGGGHRGGLSTESPVYQAYNQTRNEVKRQARVEYHERFREGVLAILGREHEQASNPQTIEDLEAVGRLLLRQGDRAAPLEGEDRAAESGAKVSTPQVAGPYEPMPFPPGNVPVLPEFHPAAVAPLRARLDDLRSLDVVEEIDPVTGLPHLGENDPLYVSAFATWNLLRAERMSEAANAFYGEFGPSDRPDFSRAFRWEVDATSRGEYRNRRVRLLEGLIEPAKRARSSAEFRDFVQRFAGWFRGQELLAPPDMSNILGDEYRDEQKDKRVRGELSQADYERLTAPFTERDQWTRRLRADYHQNWRAETVRQLNWALRAKVAGADPLALLIVQDPTSPEDLKELVEGFERAADV